MTTVATTFPDFPNDISKRKYYDFYMNLPMFIPDPEMGNKFSTMLDKYPITPYLKSKDSLIRWINFMHNKYNEMLGKPTMSIDEAMAAYLDNYVPKPVHLHRILQVRRYYLHVAFILICLAVIYYYMAE
jgi:hypothetical protein